MLGTRSGVVLVLVLLTAGCLGTDAEAEDPEITPTEEESQAPMPGDAERSSPQTVQAETVHWQAGSCTPVGTTAGIAEGVDHATVQIEPAARGLPFVAHLKPNGPHGWFSVAFYDGNGTIDVYESEPFDVTVEGTVLPGASKATFYACGGVDVSLDFTVETE